MRLTLRSGASVARSMGLCLSLPVGGEIRLGETMGRGAGGEASPFSASGEPAPAYLSLVVVAEDQCEGGRLVATNLFPSEVAKILKFLACQLDQ